MVHLADRAPRPVRDGATRHAHAPRIDAQNRVNLGKALTALGWTPETFLVAAREDGHFVVRAAADSPLLTRVPVDSDRRPTLPPVVLAGRDVRAGDQVLAAAVVDTHELHLFAVADALQALTGALPAEASPAAPQPSPATRATGSRVKGRWEPTGGSAHQSAGTRAEGLIDGRPTRRTIPVVRTPPHDRTTPVTLRGVHDELAHPRRDDDRVIHDPAWVSAQAGVPKVVSTRRSATTAGSDIAALPSAGPIRGSPSSSAAASNRRSFSG